MNDHTLQRKEMIETSESFEDAYRTYGGAIYNFLFWRTNDVQASEDLTGTTFQKAWAARRSFHGGSLQAWLYRIARNTLVDYWRKRKDVRLDDVAEMEADTATTNSELAEKQLQLEKLQLALAKLPKPMRDVVQLRFIEGMSAKQAAVTLGIEDGNVRIIQYRALKKLREYLHE